MNFYLLIAALLYRIIMASLFHIFTGGYTMLLTVQQVIDTMLQPVNRIEQTVDILEWGNPDAVVTGIATCFMPTQHVLEQAVELGCNLIIAHENAFYTHHNRTSYLEHDSVYVQKRDFIEFNQINIYRIHDYIHHFQPDGITSGLIQSLEWNQYVTEHRNTASMITLPYASLEEIAEYVKAKLGIPYVRIVGDPMMKCSHLGIMVGYRGGGEHAIPFYERDQVDLIIAGEGPEWETPEYVRDAMHQQKARALLMLGHAESEAPGMQWLAADLSRLFPNITVTYLSDKPVYTLI